MKRQSLSKDQHAFDINAEVEPVPDPMMDQTLGGAGDAGFDDIGGADDNDDAGITVLWIIFSVTLFPGGTSI